MAVISACLLFTQSCVKYQAHELNPVQAEQQFRARTPPVPLNAVTLTDFALQFSNELAVARARAAVTSAALLTARQRINPSISLDGGRNKTPDSVSTYSVSPAFTIETAGKRGYRILEAQKLAEAARISVYEAEWQARSRLRAALLSYWAAQQKFQSLQLENSAAIEIAAIYTKRLALGEASAPELNAVLADQAVAALSLRVADGEATRAVAALAAAAGLPAAALEAKPIDLAAFGNAPLPEPLPLLAVQKAGLLHRADIRRSLIEYEAADARLRLMLANQYPNITLSPAYAFQEGFPAYTLGSIIESLPLFHRNQGPIAEQEAVRLQMEAQFKALQARAVGETELALRQYTAALSEWRGAKDTVTALQQQKEAAVVAAFKAGEKDRLDVTQARLSTLTAQRSQQDALHRAHAALLALEDAVQSSPETTP